MGKQLMGDVTLDITSYSRRAERLVDAINEAVRMTQLDNKPGFMQPLPNKLKLTRPQYKSLMRIKALKPLMAGDYAYFSPYNLMECVIV